MDAVISFTTKRRRRRRTVFGTTTTSFLLFIFGVWCFSSSSCYCHAFSNGNSNSKPPSKSSSSTTPTPAWWSKAWDILLPSPGEPGTPIGVGDFLYGIRTNLEHEWFDDDTKENTKTTSSSFLQVPIAQNVDPSTMQSDFFANIRKFRVTTGNIFSLNLGATKVTYIGDQAVTKHILLNSGGYDKGLLGFIGKDVFGDGLITALDRTVWSRRRRAVAPTMGANPTWLNGLIDDFVTCTRQSFPILDQAAATKTTTIIDLEETCLAIALDALGVTVFGTQFNAANNIGTEGGDPLVKAVYRVLKETNIRAEQPASIVASFIRPHWLAELLFPEYKEFREASRVLDTKINELIAELKTNVETTTDDDNDDAMNASPSILRILVESRDSETTSQQVKDDLITLLIAGHETVASVLTWALYELSRNPSELKKVQTEIDAVLGTSSSTNMNTTITMNDIIKLQCTRRALTESLRLYPAPPLLSRRALQDDVIPVSDGNGARPPLHLKRGDNVFLLTAMLHRDPNLYGENDDAEVFRPDRWAGPIHGNKDAVPNWKGYEGPNDGRALYPSEKATDFALIGFGAGEFKCVGDKFAFVEATIVLALLLQRYEFELVTDDVGFDMAGTIHTSNGLNVHVTKRRQ